MKKLLQELAVSICAIVLALIVGAIVMFVLGRDPIDAYRRLLEGAFGSQLGFGQVIFKSTTYILAGTAIALSFRTGLFNIGAEGQIYAGTLACAVMGIYLPKETNPALAVTACVFASFFAGALAAAVPAFLKAYRGTHEVITTIMMNFIIIVVVNYLIRAYFLEIETAHTRGVIDSARIPQLYKAFGVFRGSQANVSIFLALGVCAASAWLLFRTRLGYEMRATGFNPTSAECAGVRVKYVSVVTLMLSGAIAGLCGVNYVIGHDGFMELGETEKQGYVAIAVALLARNHPFGVIPSALLFAALSEGAVKLAEGTVGSETKALREIVEILLGIIILFVAVGSIVIQNYLRARQKKRSAQIGAKSD